jgi:pantoate--beta-alanine ligase
VHLRSLKEAAPVLKALRKSPKSVGSIHTLGALHIGHREVIRASAAENDCTVVTIYPNKAQFAPGTVYRYDLEADVELALASGATHIVSSNDDEMYDAGYVTFLDQGSCYSRMDGVVVPFLFRGMITMCIRWISFVQPDRTYWGMKDIGQTVLVRQAVKDLLIPTVVRAVPCVRMRSGVPVSSRLMGMPAEALEEVARLHHAADLGRRMANSVHDRHAINKAMLEFLYAKPLQHFRLRYLDIFDPKDFHFKDDVRPPFIIHGVLSNGRINTFDGLFIESEKERFRRPGAVSSR